MPVMLEGQELPTENRSLLALVASSPPPGSGDVLVDDVQIAIPAILLIGSAALRRRCDISFGIQPPDRQIRREHRADHIMLR